MSDSKTFETMRMFRAYAFSPDSSEKVYQQILVGTDEDDAIDRLQQIMDEKEIEYGLCMAEAIDE